MPGTQVNDALAPILTTGVTLNAAGTTTTSAGTNNVNIDVLRPQRLRIELKTSTVTSTTNSATLNVEIQASNDAAFGSGNVSLGRFAAMSGTDVSQSNVTKYLEVYTQKRYIRASVIIGGTAPVYTGTTIKVKEKNFQRTLADSA